MKSSTYWFLLGLLLLVVGCMDERQETRVLFPVDNRDEHPQYTEFDDSIKDIDGERYWRFNPNYRTYNRFEEMGFYHWSEVEKLLQLADDYGFGVFFAVPWDGVNYGQKDIEFSIIYVRAVDWNAFWTVVQSLYPELAPAEIPEPLQDFIIPPLETPSFNNDPQA